MEELLERYLTLKQNLSIEIYADFLQYLSTVEVYTVVRKVEGVEEFNYISFKGNQSKYLAIFSCEETKKAFLDKNKCSIKKCKFMTLANRVIEDNTTGIVIDPISEDMYFVIEQQDLITMVLSDHLTKINDAKNIKKKIRRAFQQRINGLQILYSKVHKKTTKKTMPINYLGRKNRPR